MIPVWHYPGKRQVATAPAIGHNTLMFRWKTIVAGLVLLTMQPHWVLADSSKSSNFRIDESFIGGGGRIDEGSPNFRASETIGDVGVGNSASANFQTNSGGTTTSDPSLSFIIDNSGVVNFGTLTPTLVNHATSSFRVINYTSYGYNVTISGTTPVSDLGHYLPALTTPSTPTIGTEEYGLNVVANTSWGANPLQVPSVTFGFGVAQGPDYNQPNKYKFVSGDVIASAPKSSGETDYTISHIIDVSALTTGGQYTGAHELICTGTY